MESYFVWNADPEIIKIWFVSVRWYGLLFGLSFLFGSYYMQSVFVREGKNTEDLDSLFICVVIGTLVGARLFHVLFYDPAYYFSHPFKILKVWEGGLASHGGGIGIIAAILYFISKKKGYSFLWLTDKLSLPVIFGGALIRIGNFFNSEIVGNPSNLPWAIVFKHVDNIPRHPSQLYESILYIFIAIVLFYLSKRADLKEKKGLLTSIFLILVFTGRILLEFFKTDQESYQTMLFLNTGQLLSIPMVIVGLIMFLRIVNFRKKS